MPKVNSSNIYSIECQDLEGTLCDVVVTFKNGSSYIYFEVPQTVYQSFINASSVGRYFAANIKGKYESVKL